MNNPTSTFIVESKQSIPIQQQEFNQQLIKPQGIAFYPPPEFGNGQQQMNQYQINPQFQQYGSPAQQLFQSQQQKQEQQQSQQQQSQQQQSLQQQQQQQQWISQQQQMMQLQHHNYLLQNQLLNVMNQSTAQVNSTLQNLQQQQNDGLGMFTNLQPETITEYIPVEKTIIEYETKRRKIQVPVTQEITEYVPVTTERLSPPRKTILTPPKEIHQIIQTPVNPIITHQQIIPQQQQQLIPQIIQQQQIIPQLTQQVPIINSSARLRVPFQQVNLSQAFSSPVCLQTPPLQSSPPKILNRQDLYQPQYVPQPQHVPQPQYIPQLQQPYQQTFINQQPNFIQPELPPPPPEFHQQFAQEYQHQQNRVPPYQIQRTAPFIPQQYQMEEDQNKQHQQNQDFLQTRQPQYDSSNYHVPNYESEQIQRSDPIQYPRKMPFIPASYDDYDQQEYVEQAKSFPKRQVYEKRQKQNTQPKAKENYYKDTIFQ